MKVDVANKTHDVVCRAGVKILPKQNKRLEDVSRVQFHELRACSKLAVKIIDKRDKHGRIPCPYCSAAFKNRSGLSGHIQASHADKLAKKEDETLTDKIVGLLGGCTDV